MFLHTFITLTERWHCGTTTWCIGGMNRRRIWGYFRFYHNILCIKYVKAWDRAYSRVFHKILYKLGVDNPDFITKLGHDKTEFITKKVLII